MYRFRLSHHKNKKYDVYYDDKWIPFGDSRYEHYRTSNAIPQELHVYPEHHDDERRMNYLRRATKLRDANGKLTWKNKTKANYWAINLLW